MRVSGETFFPHEYGDIHGQFGDQIIDLRKDLAMEFLLASVVQMAKPLRRCFALFISKNGEPRASLRQISGKDAEAVRISSLLSAFADSIIHQNQVRPLWSRSYLKAHYIVCDKLLAYIHNIYETSL